MAGMGECVLLPSFDEYTRLTEILLKDSCESEFLQFLYTAEELRKNLLDATKEVTRLKSELDRVNLVNNNLEIKLRHARRLIDTEKKNRKNMELQMESLFKQINLVKDILFTDDASMGMVADNVKEKLVPLFNTTRDVSSMLYDREMGYPITPLSKLETINEAMDTTGSLLSELSYSRSADELDESDTKFARVSRKTRCSNSDETPARKRSRSSKTQVLSREISPGDCLVATTTVKIKYDGPESTPTTHIKPSAPVLNSPEEIPPDYGFNGEKVGRNRNSTGQLVPSPHVGGIHFDIDKRFQNHRHNFIPKTIIRPLNCEPCNKKIRFGKLAVKCKDCRTFYHIECKDKAPLPCVPTNNTPRKNGELPKFADFAPSTPPMIPALIVHCIREVESRMNEVGIYRVPGSDKDVKTLKQKFFCGRVPNLETVEIHVICTLIKEFLRSFDEPLVTFGLWNDFASASKILDEEERNSAYYQVISELPQPNKDTLAYLLLHLQNVAQCTVCKMPASNLAKVFGPTIIGYSVPEPSPLLLTSETKTQVSILEHLLNIPSNYYTSIVNGENFTVPASTPRYNSTPQLPSSQYFTPQQSKSLRNTPRRYFTNPPISKFQ